MKNIFDKNKFRELAEVSGEKLITIYLPSNHDRWIDPTKDINRIKLKNFIKKIGEELRDHKRDGTEELLEPLQTLLDDDYQWGYLMPGRVIFRDKERFEYYTVPVDIDEMYYIGRHFYLQPLVRTVHLNHEFYVLALDLKSVELYRANLFDIAKLNVQQFIPSSIEEAVGRDYEQQVMQFRSGQEGGGRALFHGQKEGMEIKKTVAGKFFRYVDDGIMEVLPDREKKLVVVSVDYLFSMFREISNYPNLAGKNISIGPGNIKPEEMKEKAIRILEENFEQEREDKKQEFQEAVDKTNVSETIVTAAYIGQIDTLFLAKEEMLWGKFNPEEARTELHNGYHEGDISLNNLATVQTLLKNGQV